MGDIVRKMRWAHTPASFGVEITEEHDGNTSEMSLVNPRGTGALWFSLKHAGTWSRVVTVTNPERFVTGPIKTPKDFEAVVAVWNAASDAMAAKEVEEEPEEVLECLDAGPDCSGTVEYRAPLSATGRSFPRCDKHWSDRLDTQDRINRRYPDTSTPPSDFDPSYAGESWDED